MNSNQITRRCFRLRWKLHERCHGYALYVWSKHNPFFAYSRAFDKWAIVVDLRVWHWQKIGGDYEQADRTSR